METIHIDRYDAEQNQGGSSESSGQPQPQPWFARFLPGGVMPKNLEIPAGLNEASHKVTSFVKERPGVAIAAALGVGFLLKGGLRRHPLLKSAFAAFGVPYIRRQFIGAR